MFSAELVAALQAMLHELICASVFVILRFFIRIFWGVATDDFRMLHTPGVVFIVFWCFMRIFFYVATDGFLMLRYLSV